MNQFDIRLIFASTIYAPTEISVRRFLVKNSFLPDMGEATKKAMDPAPRH